MPRYDDQPKSGKLKDRLRFLMKQYVDLDAVTRHTDVWSMLDELDRVLFVMDVEEHFEIEVEDALIDDGSLSNMKSVRDMVKERNPNRWTPSHK